jgi:hypothetical protein
MLVLNSGDSVRYEMYVIDGNLRKIDFSKYMSWG